MLYPLAQCKKFVANLRLKKKTLQKNGINISEFLEEPYKMPGNQPRKPNGSTSVRVVPYQSAFIKETMAAVDNSLVQENAQLRERCREGAAILIAKEKEIEKLRRK